MKRLIFVICILFLFGCTDQLNQEKGLDNAKNYANLLNNGSKTYEYSVIECSGLDSDGDGYVSCTFNRTNLKTEEETLEVFDCNYSYNFFSSNTCKLKNYVSLPTN